MTFTPNNEPPHTAKMIKSITEGSHNFKEGIGVAFAQLQGMPPENREELFRESFAPGSYWGEILAEKQKILTETFGEQGYLLHPHKQEIDVMALVLLGKLRLLQEQEAVKGQ